MAILLLLFGLAYSLISWRAEKTRELQYLASLAQLGETALDSYFLSIQSALYVLSEDIRRENGRIDLDHADLLLRRLKQANTELRIAVVVRVDGQVLATTETSRGQPLPSLAHEPSFIKGLEELSAGQALAIGRPFLGPISKEWVIPLRYGVRDEQGKLRFVLGAGVHLAKPQSFWKDAPLPGGAALGVVRDDGYLVVRYPLPKNADLAQIYGASRDGTLINFLRQEGFPTSGIVEGVSRVSGAESLFIFRRLAHFPATFYVAEPRTYLWAMWWQKVQFAYVLMLLLIVGAFAVYRWTRSRQIAWEAERYQRMRELEAVNRELESFAYSISHDLRAPVRHIDGFAKMLAEEAPGLNQTAGRYLQTISKSALRMGTMIDELLEFSRTSRAEVRNRRVDLNRVVAEARDECSRDSRGRNIAWKVDELPAVMGDAALLRLVFVNLLSNAIKFTSRRAEAVIEIGVQPDADEEAIVYVRDNGTGFDMRYSSKLFGVFQRLHREADFEGTGIGLATVQRIVQRHGGRVWADAEPDRGATFYVALKRAGEGTDGGHAKSSASVGQSR